MNFDIDFTSINVNFLIPNMNIDFDVYYKTPTLTGMEYVLLCRNVVLNEELIKKFRRVTAPHYVVYVPNQNYESTFKHYVEGHIEQEVVHFEGYNNIKEDTNEVFADISKSHKISKEKAVGISQTINEQLHTVAATEIIKSINSIRKVDEYLYTHSVNVSFLNGLIGRWLKYDPANLETLIKVGLLHDIGKLSIPPEILNKPAKLTPAEFAVMKQHPTYSYNILIESKIEDEGILKGVVQHHEKVNGTGYPMGLSSDAITAAARITSISDVYDAMVAKRVYKDAHSPFEILSWFSEGCYSDLDINYVNIFLDCMVEELKGKKVVLSDDSIATVLYVHKKDFNYPIVELNGEVVHTDKKRNCIRML
ncbi:MAG: HD-GYP domain-containing protein [Oscillospiraceae bacterium]|nr:HD-GYP domain-containing protein [Oscillospiraceae bacterium]